MYFIDGLPRMKIKEENQRRQKIEWALERTHMRSSAHQPEGNRARSQSSAHEQPDKIEHQLERMLRRKLSYFKKSFSNLY